MRELFRNTSKGALTRAQAVEIAKKQAQAERAECRRIAEDLARQGRGEDTEIAHVARGELVIPEALQSPEVLAMVRRAARENNISFDRLRVGNSHNSINPETGLPEFLVMSDEMRRKAYQQSIDRTLPPPSVTESFIHGVAKLPQGAGELAANVGGLFSDAAKAEAQRLTAYNAAMEDAYQARRAAGGQTGLDIPNIAGQRLTGYAVGAAFPKAASYGAATAFGAAKGP